MYSYKQKQAGGFKLIDNPAAAGDNSDGKLKNGSDENSFRARVAPPKRQSAGVTGRPARRMASAALAMRDEQDITLRAAMTQVYCARLCYVLVTSVGFLLILLILAAIGNLPNLAFQLPNREKLNDIGGAAFGAVNGVCFGILLCWALQFAGPVIGRDTLAHTALAKALQAIDVLTLGVGV